MRNTSIINITPKKNANPRSSAIEINQVLNLTGGAYVFENYRARGRVVFQNKPPMCQYRAVGHPIAISVAESLVELAASAIDMESMQMRQLNMAADDDYPNKTVTGIPLENLSHQESTKKANGNGELPGN